MAENQWRMEYCPEGYEMLWCDAPFDCQFCNGAWSCDDIAMITDEVMASADTNEDG